MITDGQIPEGRAAPAVIATFPVWGVDRGCDIMLSDTTKALQRSGSWLPALYFCVTAVRRDTTFTCGLVIIPLSDT